MKLSKRKRSTAAAMNMTPMIDIVFLLIVFFMTVTQISEINKEHVQLPQERGSGDQIPATITINVNRDGEILVSGAVYSLAELANIVADEIVRQRDDPSRVIINLRADRRGESRTVNRIVSQLDDLGVRKIHIAVEEGV